MKKNVKLAAFAVLGASVFALAACGGTNPNPTPDDEATY